MATTLQNKRLSSFDFHCSLLSAFGAYTFRRYDTSDEMCPYTSKRNKCEIMACITHYASITVKVDESALDGDYHDDVEGV
jgi:hypothetical protein